MRLRMDMQVPEIVVVLIRGRVMGLEPKTGRTLWETKLPKTYGSYIGTVMIDGDLVLAGVAGRIHALDVRDGRLLWTNDMPGLGHGMVAMATPSASANGAAQAVQQAAGYTAAVTGAAAGTC